MSNVELEFEFPLHRNLIYLNHAAVAPWPQRTADAVRQFALENARSGAANYPNWVTQEAQCRKQLQTLLNAPSVNDIALLKNTSEALSIVAYGIDWQAGDNIIISDQEFPSNRIVWESLADRGVNVKHVNLNSAATPEDALMAATDARTRLLSISSVQYASGLRMDLETLGTYCQAQGILFCVDAIQSLGAVKFDVQRINADFVMADGHKWMLGPEGIAVFYCKAEQRDTLKLNQYGWHMVEAYMDFDRQDWQIAKSARRFECGSPNMLGIFALSASLSLLAEVGMDNVEQRVVANCRYLMDKLGENKKIELISSSKSDRYAGIVTFNIKNNDPTKLHQSLLKNNIICALRGGGIRFSPHFYTTTAVLDRALEHVHNTTS